MTKTTQGLPVQGYQPQTEANIALVNRLKVAEETALRILDEIKARSDLDQRGAAIAFTALQDGFMWACRSVFQPQRIAL